MYAFGLLERLVECQSALNWDPSYCLICECYPDGAIGADDPTSTDRLHAAALQPRSTRGAVGGSGRAVHSPGRGGSGRPGACWLLSSNELLGGLLSKCLQQTLHDRMLWTAPDFPEAILV